MGYGLYAYGVRPYAGTGSLAAVGEETASIVFLEANDRHQAIICFNNGVLGVPQWAYWNPAPAVWSEALASVYPDDYPPFYALDNAGAPVRGVYQSEVFQANPGFEYKVAGLWIDFKVRPTLMDDHDGGLGVHSPGFKAFVEGWGVPGIETTSAGDSLTTSVVRSDPVQEWSGDADDLSVEPWPHHRSVRLPCRLIQSVRAYRFTIYDVVGVELEGVSIVGVMVDMRKK